MSVLALAFITIIGVSLIATFGTDDDDNEE
jgi:hypothetical protein